MIIPPRISRTLQNHFVSILGVVAICILLFVFILPAKHRPDHIQEDLAAAKEEMRGHKAALSLLENKLSSMRQTRSEREDTFQELETELDTLQAKLSEKIVFNLPEISPFPDSVDMLPKVLQEMAGKHGLRKVIIDLKKPPYALNWPGIAVTMTATGTLPDFRAFVIHLLETPYVAAINELQFSSCKNGICLNIDLSIRMD